MASQSQFPYYIFGTIAVGMQAGLFLVNGNTLQDIKNTRWISGVAVSGIWLPNKESRKYLKR